MLGFWVPNNYCLLQADIGTFACLRLIISKVVIELGCLKIAQQR